MLETLGPLASYSASSFVVSELSGWSTYDQGLTYNLARATLFNECHRISSAWQPDAPEDLHKFVCAPISMIAAASLTNVHPLTALALEVSRISMSAIEIKEGPK